jgi:minor extracellular serine protease Vpr
MIKAVVKRTSSSSSEAFISGVLHLETNRQTIRIPYIYAMKEPNYPRLMGFSISKGDKKGTIHYEAYLPRGASEFGIALFDEHSLHFIGFLDTERNVPPGMKEKEVPIIHGKYKDVVGVIFARNKGYESTEAILLHLKD